MAARCRSLSRPSLALLKSTITKPFVQPRRTRSLLSSPFLRTFSRPNPQLGALQSLLPLHSAVSSARLTPCLGIDFNSRSLSQAWSGFHWNRCYFSWLQRCGSTGMWSCWSRAYKSC